MKLQVLLNLQLVWVTISVTFAVEVTFSVEVTTQPDHPTVWLTLSALCCAVRWWNCVSSLVSEFRVRVRVRIKVRVRIGVNVLTCTRLRGLIALHPCWVRSSGPCTGIGVGTGTGMLGLGSLPPPGVLALPPLPCPAWLAQWQDRRQMPLPPAVIRCARTSGNCTGYAQA